MSDRRAAARKVEERRQELEALADTDAPTAWIAEELLEAAKDVRGGGA